MISYRALKKLVGETSLERKCRFLFGAALLLLIIASFWVYASRTRALVEHQQVLAARSSVPDIVQMRHYQLFIRGDAERAAERAPERAGSAANDDSATNSPASPSSPRDSSPPASAPYSPFQLERYERAVNEAANEPSGKGWRLINIAREDPPNEDAFAALQLFQDEDDPADEHWFIREEEGEPRVLWYYQALRADSSCLACHPSEPTEGDVGPAIAAAGPPAADAVETRPPLLGIAQVTRSMELVDQQLSRNRAILLASGIVTSFLAMLAAYAIVRYIIVKPVLHLKDVSDEIARGNLNLRAEITTGDEFEELSHAFNRMLRHMMTVNDELRSLNMSLDAKIDQLAQANMELFSNNKLKDEFLATISHELRTPLNSILGFSDLMQESPNLNDRQKRYVSNIQTSGRSLMVQINDLLDLAKIESGRMELHPAEMQLADVIESQVQQVMPLADRRNIDLRVEAPGDPLPPLFQDSGKIAQILNNLLSNAIKFTPEGGRIRVAYGQPDPGTVEFSVADTGIGIPLQDQAHIFEKFRQGTTAPGNRDHVKREYEGTGLGLSIVRELSRLLGGDVLLESEFGKGSLFVVRIPVEAPAQKPQDAEPSIESHSSSGIGRITAVDLLNADEEPPRTPPVKIEFQSVTAPRS